MSERLTDEQIKTVWTWCMTGSGIDVDQLILRMVEELQERRAADATAMRWEYEERPREQDADCAGYILFVDVDGEWLDVQRPDTWTQSDGPYLRNWRTALRTPEDKT